MKKNIGISEIHILKNSKQAICNDEKGGKVPKTYRTTSLFTNNQMACTGVGTHLIKALKLIASVQLRQKVCNKKSF